MRSSSGLVIAPKTSVEKRTTVRVMLMIVELLRSMLPPSLS